MNLIVQKTFGREDPLRLNRALSKEVSGGVGLLLSGQTGHGRADHLVLFSLFGSLEKVQDGAGIILRSLLIGVVAAFGEDRQLAPWKVAVESR